MKRAIKSFGLMAVAAVGVTIASIPVLVVMSVRNRRKLPEYWRTVAIGMDQVGGSIIYGTEDWTISSWTHWLCKSRGGRFCRFERLIDSIFGPGHCARSWDHERRGGLQ